VSEGSIWSMVMALDLLDLALVQLVCMGAMLVVMGAGWCRVTESPPRWSPNG